MNNIFYWTEHASERLGNAIFALPAVFLTAFIYWLVRRSLQKHKFGFKFSQVRKKARLNEIMRLLLICWVATAACFTLFPADFWAALHRLITEGYWDMGQFQFGEWSWKYVPVIWYFIFEIDFADTYVKLGLIADMIENVILFMPLGLLLPLIWRGFGFVKTVVAGFLCTAFIELVQPFIMRDGTIDDVIFNTLGAAAGYLLYLAVKGALPRFAERCGVRAE